MKKTFLGFFVLMILFIAGCASTSKIQVLAPYDPTLTPENASTFIFPKEIMIQKMDNNPVSSFEGSVPGWISASGKPASILIPPGEHIFSCIFLSQIGGKTLSASDLSVGANFEAGKTYLLTYQISDTDNTVNLAINEQAIVE
jgi:hypothetical protein